MPFLKSFLSKEIRLNSFQLETPVLQNARKSSRVTHDTSKSNLAFTSTATESPPLQNLQSCTATETLNRYWTSNQSIRSRITVLQKSSEKSSPWNEGKLSDVKKHRLLVSDYMPNNFSKTAKWSDDCEKKS